MTKYVKDMRIRKMKISSIVTTAKEGWKDIKGYEGYYQISNRGNVKSLDRVLNQWFKHGRYEDRQIKGQPLATTDNGNGYLIVSLNKNNKRKNHYVHRLVAEHFIGSIPTDYTVNHKDFNRKNNNVDNLEIITQFDNVQHALENGRFEVERNYKKSYENITEETKNKVEKLYKFMTLNEIAKEVKICRLFVSNILDERGVEKRSGNNNRFTKEHIARKEMLLRYRQTGQLT